jgi:diphthamide biosynthesis protein 2
MTQLTAPPILSTPETYIFEDPTTPLISTNEPKLSDEAINDVYEIERTVRGIHDGGWRRVALQFPDVMLGDAGRVVGALEMGLKRGRIGSVEKVVGDGGDSKVEEGEFESFNGLSTAGEIRAERHRLCILADTSYGACCVDEIAAEHVDAQVVVHYGRSCLSPTARLPVIYVFTTRPLVLDDVVDAFVNTYPEKEERVVLMADITYNSHIPALESKLKEQGYESITAPEVIHNPESIIPNRNLEGMITEEELKEHSLFHISDPPPALLLTLSSRVKGMHIYPTTTTTTTSSTTLHPKTALQTNTAVALRRRYALVTSLTTVPTLGILIQTLSVSHYLSSLSHIKALISAAGKKSYTFVVGKINAAKIANFAEIGGWVVVGCWESSLIESREFAKSIVTPFELALALQRDDERVWSGAWRGGFDLDVISGGGNGEANNKAMGEDAKAAQLEERGLGNGNGGDLDSEEESEPPEFDLRTGRYVSHSRPMRTTIPSTSPLTTEGNAGSPASKVLTRRAKGDLATVNGAVSPGAEYLRSQRTWTGLGSDFAETEASDRIEEGRSGVARGYSVGGEGERR